MSAPEHTLLPSASLPPRLRAGDALAWSVQTRLPLGSTVFYVLTGVVSNVPVRIQVAPVNVDASGTAAFSLASTVTKTYQPGRYEWVAFSADADGNRDELAQGQIRILPDPTGTTPVDPRSHNERMLDQIKAVLLNNAMDDVAMYKIGGRELTKVPRETLLKQLGIYEARVLNERRRNGERVPGKNVGITFGRRP